MIALWLMQYGRVELEFFKSREAAVVEIEYRRAVLPSVFVLAIRPAVLS